MTSQISIGDILTPRLVFLRRRGMCGTDKKGQALLGIGPGRAPAFVGAARAILAEIGGISYLDAWRARVRRT
jgi:hypothetical protein